MLKLFTILFLCGFLSSCGHFKKIKEAKKAAEAVAGAKPLITLPKSDFKPTIELDGPIKPPAPAPPRDSTLVDIDTKNTYKAADLYDAGKEVTLKEIDDEVKDRLSSSSTLSSGQSRMYFLVFVPLCVLGAIVSFACKIPKTGIVCVGGALFFCLLPSIIEAIHRMLEGLVVSFYILLGVGLISLGAWIFWKAFHHEAKPKPLKVEK